MDDTHIDLNPYVGAILSVLTEPYQTFVSELWTDGRISDEEVAALKAAIRDRGKRLGELVKAKLLESDQNPDQS